MQGNKYGCTFFWANMRMYLSCVLDPYLSWEKRVQTGVYFLKWKVMISFKK